MTEHILYAFKHTVHRNILLLGILCAIWMSMEHPAAANAFGSFDVNTPLVAAIFLVEGLHMTLAGSGNFRMYLKELGWAALITAVLYPLAAAGLAWGFGVESDARVGFLLLSSLPGSSASIAMAASAGGDPFTAMLLLIAMSLLGIISIPLDLALWLGSSTPVSELLVMKKLVLFLVLPALCGQVLRGLFPRLPERIAPVTKYVPTVCISLLVYFSCSRESALLHGLRLDDLMHVIVPCLLLHGFMLGFTWLVGRRSLHMEDGPARSFLFVISEKPMSLSVALWSMTYAHHHPLAIFPILVFYVCQVLFDSIVVSRMVADDSRNG
ncbi:bile acid:sodium symporter [Pseudodesulfovibrio sp.]|uniref:bile acid:sodium symporter n=1 Tax=unclassified Pseudodesulfovibrio TaxID=2661612 RepID=UPI003AFFBB5B